MKIDRVETAWLAIESPEPQGLSSGYMTHSADGLCRISTACGIQGIGEGRGASPAAICRVIDEVFKPLLLRENPLHTQYLWQKLHNAVHDEQGRLIKGFTNPVLYGALCAIDLALWDIKGKAAGMSVCELLGGKPRAVPAYIQKGFYVKDQSKNEMADEAVRVLTAGGYKHLKMRIGMHSLEDDCKRVEVMRKALGQEISLMVDVNQAWDLPEAIEATKALERYNLAWIEEPLGRYPKTGPREGYNWNVELGKLAKETSIPLAAGENHFAFPGFLDLIANGGIEYFQMDVAKNSGGLSECLKAFGMCEARGIRIAPHLVPQFHVHVVSAAPTGFIVECGDDAKQHPSWPHLFDGWPEVKDGHLQCPTEPGWGLSINEDMVRRHGTVIDWDCA
jgi:D-galactarolactone cycloisomerase